MMPRRSAIALGFGLAVVVFLLGLNVHYRAAGSGPSRSDLPVFHAAGKAVLDQHDIYEVRHPQRHWPFLYPPFAAIAFIPLSLLPFGAAVVAWYAVSVAALGWSLRRIAQICAAAAKTEDAGTTRAADVDRGDRGAGSTRAPNVGLVVAGAVVANILATVSGLQRGQISALLFALMVEAVWSFQRGRDVRCGMWIAIAASLKLYPALLLAPLVLRRAWRGLAGFGATLLVCWVLVPVSVMGPQAAMAGTREFFQRMAVPAASGDVSEEVADAEVQALSPSNQSWFGFLGRWLCSGSLPDNHPHPVAVADVARGDARRLALAASVLTLLGMLAVLLRRHARGSWEEAVAWTLPMIVANLVSPIAWHHYYTVLILPYALLGIRIAREPGTGPARSALALLAFAIATNWLYFAVFAARQAGLLFFGSLVLAAGLGVLAARRGEAHSRRTAGNR